MDIRAYAKINLILDVVRKRADGYHDLRMVMQMTGMYDLLRIEPKSEPGIELTTNLPYLPTDGRNLAVRSAGLHEFFTVEGHAAVAAVPGLHRD